MAISLRLSHAIIEIAMSELARSGKSSLRVCCLGCPDILFTEKELIRSITRAELSEFLLRQIKQLPVSPCETELQMTARRFFNLLGCRLYSIDAVAHSGEEIICDLNGPGQADPYSEMFDIVFDNGTLEHCFNIGQAFINAAKLVSIHGVILHINPFIMPNHGFYSMNPTVYSDFYSDNGFEICDAMLLISPSAELIGKLTEIQLTKRFSLGESKGDVVISVVARRVRSKKEFVYPLQTKYKSKWAKALNR